MENLRNIRIPVIKANEITTTTEDGGIINLFIGTTEKKRINEIIAIACDELNNYKVEKYYTAGFDFANNTEIEDKKWFVKLAGRIDVSNIEIIYNGYKNTAVIQGQNLVIMSEHTGFEIVIWVRFKGNLKP